MAGEFLLAAILIVIAGAAVRSFSPFARHMRISAFLERQREFGDTRSFIRFPAGRGSRRLRSTDSV
jgi:hypothetical protein